MLSGSVTKSTTPKGDGKALLPPIANLAKVQNKLSTNVFTIALGTLGPSPK